MIHWYLVDGCLPQRRRGNGALADDGAFLALGDGCLPILPSGRVHEIVALPAPPQTLEPGLTVRRLGAPERTWRMAWRVFRTWRRLSRAQRQESGLTLKRALKDLAGAYRAATAFRGFAYSTWCGSVDRLTDMDRSGIRAHMALWRNPPTFRLVLVGGGEPAMRKMTLESAAGQLYSRFTVHEAGPPIFSPDDWLLLVRPGDRLAEHALYWFAHEIRVRPDAAVIYADDDVMDGAGRRQQPRFKPDWSHLHLLATDYIGRAAVLRGSSVIAAGGLTAQNLAGNTYELLLRVAEVAGDGVGHIPAVLLHRPAGEPEPERRRVPVALPDSPPLVSIVIPTRDAAGLLRQCVESVLAKTTYPRFELLVIDNGSRETDALAYLDEVAGRPGVRVLRWDRRFNYSAINNFAAREARGEVLCLLNNDTEVISPDWLEEMVGHLHGEKVGVVGAKLYYPDGRVQHAGDTVGPGGCANHLHAFIGRNDPGYCGRAAVAQELSAVTAACLVTWRELYLRLGGLNERRLKVAFNDVDYCLRVRQAGHKVVWTPHAELYHHESVSRGKDRSLRRKIQAELEVRYMRRTWREEMKNDPFYNPNFSYLRADFALSPAPRVRRPWRS